MLMAIIESVVTRRLPPLAAITFCTPWRLFNASFWPIREPLPPPLVVVVVDDELDDEVAALLELLALIRDFF